jgi:hypothetical protein
VKLSWLQYICSGILNYKFKFLQSCSYLYNLFHIRCVVVACGFLELVHFIRIVKLMCVKLTTVLSFDVLRVWHDSPFHSQFCWVPVAHACNPSYLRGWDQEDHSLRLAWENSLWDPISKVTRARWTRGVAQTVEHLLCNSKTLSSNSSLIKKKSFTRILSIFLTFLMRQTFFLKTRSC